MIRKVFILCSIVLLCSSEAAAYPLYWGSVSSGNGLVGTARWASKVTFSWDIEFDDIDDVWKYDYTLRVPRKSISHIVIETSSTFTEENLFAGTTDYDELGLIGAQGNSNPNIPESVYGIKFEPEHKTTTYYFSIVTDRAPVWGDFYAKSGRKARGKWNTVYNAGFTSPDSDPDSFFYPPSNGSVGGHVLVPDTLAFIPDDGPTNIPEPLSLILLGLTVSFLGGRNFFRSSK